MALVLSRVFLHQKFKVFQSVGHVRLGHSSQLHVKHESDVKSVQKLNEILLGNGAVGVGQFTVEVADVRFREVGEDPVLFDDWLEDR